jgi:hypothetical protein
MTSDEAQRVLFMHWPGFMPEARHDPHAAFVVRLVSWPPSRARERGELQARSSESFEAALRDLASFTPPLIRCREEACILCTSH